jgi:hypothetical protein
MGGSVISASGVHAQRYLSSARFAPQIAAHAACDPSTLFRSVTAGVQPAVERQNAVALSLPAKPMPIHLQAALPQGESLISPTMRPIA